MPDITRTAISLPKSLMMELDHLISELGIKSRSRAIAEAISLYVSERYWLVEEREGTVTGSLTVIYRHHESSEGVAHVQHHYTDVIRSTSHVHLDEDLCLEVIIVLGPLSKIRELVRELQSVRGVEVIKPFLLPLSR